MDEVDVRPRVRVGLIERADELAQDVEGGHRALALELADDPKRVVARAAGDVALRKEPDDRPGNRGKRQPDRSFQEAHAWRINSRTSPSAGNRPSAFLENTLLPSTVTSKTPPLPAISSLSTERTLFSSAARPAARGL